MQKRIQAILDRSVSEGKERGVQFAAYLDGKLAVDASSGIANPADGSKVDGSTLFPVFSTTKGIAATVVHLLVERRLISYDTPIADLWPEFGVRGKQLITLRQALNHSAGIPQMPGEIGFAEMCDWDTICKAVAGLPPLWEPGTRIEYHAMTYGWIVGEVARRVDGRSFAQLVDDEIKRPLGAEDLYVGIPDAVEDRVAILEHPGCPIPDPHVTTPESVPSWMGPLYGIMNRPDVRRACIPASSGIASARSIALHYAALLPGGIDGLSLLPPDRIRIATQPQAPEKPAGDFEKNRGLGYGLGSEESFMGCRTIGFGHGGFGGSLGFAYPEARLAIGFTRNLFANADANTLPLVLNEFRTDKYV
ncbi:MAG: serine hydrolase domain-containing protein [Verrucomicrobiota bacterium]